MAQGGLWQRAALTPSALQAQGVLLQIFTKPLSDRPTVFVEIIQRIGCEQELRGPAGTPAPQKVVLCHTILHCPTQKCGFPVSLLTTIIQLLGVSGMGMSAKQASCHAPWCVQVRLFLDSFTQEQKPVAGSASCSPCTHACSVSCPC